MAKENFSSLIKKAQNNRIETPMQKVVPVETKKETLFSLYVPDELLHLLKLKALNEKTSVKKLINDALKEKYINQ